MPTRKLCGLLWTSGLFVSALAGQTVDLGALSPAEQASARTRIEQKERVLLKTGVHRSLGSATLPATGGRIRSLGAEAVRVHITGLDARDGELVVRAANGADAATYTGRGPHGDGEFWSQSVFGEEAVLEFRRGPSGASATWRVTEISHSFRQAAGEEADPLSCHLDINCHPEWNETAKSVAMFRFETPQGQSACSGALVRTKSGSGIPYFITANHCVGDEQTARTVETYWNFVSPSCNAKKVDIAKAIRPPVAGARYVTGDLPNKGDFALIVLNSIPAGARFATVDPRDPAIGAPVVGIHHPLASHQRVSFGESFSGYWTFDTTSFPTNLFHQIRWRGGDIYFGSSGSPLFSGRDTITGIASHIAQFSDLQHCEQDPKVVGYAKLSVAWPLFQPYLDDPSPSSLAVAPKEIRVALENGAVRDGGLQQTLVVNSTSETPVPVTVTSADNWVRVTKPQGTAQAGAPFVTEVQLRPELLVNRTGLIRSRLEIVSGNNGSVVPVDADLIVLASDVRLQAKSTAIADAADGCRYRMDLTLNERAGVSTQLSAFRINGEDYTSRITEWFGSTELKGKGSLSTNLKVCWPGPLSAYELIVAGRDAGSGRSWSQITMLEFK